DGIRGFHVTGVQTCALPFFGLVLDGIADCGAGDRAGDGGGVLLAATAVLGNFAGGNGADHAAEDGAGAAVLAGAVDRNDALDLAAVVAALRLVVARVAAVAVAVVPVAAVAGRAAGTGGQRHGDAGGDQELVLHGGPPWRMGPVATLLPCA